LARHALYQAGGSGVRLGDARTRFIVTRMRIFAAGATLILTFVVSLAANESNAQGGGQEVLTGAAAFNDYQSDAPGVRRLITPADLPQPEQDRVHVNHVSIVRPPANAQLKVPP